MFCEANPILYKYKTCSFLSLIPCFFNSERISSISRCLLLSADSFSLFLKYWKTSYCQAVGGRTSSTLTKLLPHLLTPSSLYRLVNESIAFNNSGVIKSTLSPPRIQSNHGRHNLCCGKHRNIHIRVHHFSFVSYSYACHNRRVLFVSLGL